jgi:hypothetical protein
MGSKTWRGDEAQLGRPLGMTTSHNDGICCRSADQEAILTSSATPLPNLIQRRNACSQGAERRARPNLYRTAE